MALAPVLNQAETRWYVIVLKKLKQLIVYAYKRKNAVVVQTCIQRATVQTKIRTYTGRIEY